MKKVFNYLGQRLVLFYAIGMFLLHNSLLCQNKIDYPSNFTIKQWKTDNGLPQNSVNAIYQTSDGYIWLATYGGLVRFDGVTFTVFNSENIAAIKNSRATAIMRVSKNDFIVRCENRGYILKRESVFSYYDNLDSLVAFFYREKYGSGQIPMDSVFILTEKNLLFLKNMSYNIDGKSEKLSELIKKYTYFDGANGAIWFNKSQKELITVDGDHLTSYKSDTPLERIFSLFRDSSGNVWLLGGIASFYRIQNEKVIHENQFYNLTNSAIYAIKEYNKDILVGNDTKGLLIIRGDEYSYWNKSNGLPDNHIKSIFIDKERNIWLGANTGGLIHLKKRKVSVITNSDPNIHSIIQPLYFDSKGDLLVGTNGTGLHRWKGNKYYEADKLTKLSRYIYSVFSDSKGRIWFGTSGSGVYVYDGKSIQNYSHENSSVGNKIRLIFEDSRNNIWVGSEEHGITKLEGDKQTVYDKSNGLGANFIISMIEDRDNNFWFGTNGYGLVKMHNGKFEYFSTKNGLTNDIVRGLYQDTDGCLWIGTYGGGLLRFKNGKFGIIKKENGLFDDIVHFIVEDEMGRFWMASNRGIFSAYRNELNDFVDKRKENISCISFGKAEGMLSEECNGGFQPNAAKSKDGKIYIPTIEGVAVIDYLNLTTNTIPPPIIIESIIADDYEESITSKVFSVKAGTKKITIKFAGLSYTDPKKMLFKTILTGFDDKWSNAANKREISYTNLPPGEYNFKVVGCNNDGIWNMNGDTITIIVEPYFYQTLVFKIIFILLLIGIAAIIILWRNRMSAIREAELQKIISEKTIQLTNEIKERKAAEDELLRIKKIDSMAVLIGGISHDFNNILTAILGNLSIAKIKTEQKKYDSIESLLEKIETASLRAKQLTHQLRIFSTSVKVSKTRISLSDIFNKAISLFSSEKLYTFDIRLTGDLQYVDVDQEQIIRALQSIITNSIEAMPEGGVITLKAMNEIIEPDRAKIFSIKSGNFVKITIEDTGIGITSENIGKVFDPYFTTKPRTNQKGGGLSMAIVYTVIKQHGGFIYVDSIPGEGATFTILLPAIDKK